MSARALAEAEVARVAPVQLPSTPAGSCSIILSLSEKDDESDAPAAADGVDASVGLRSNCGKCHGV
jgi:hypothetical protein